MPGASLLMETPFTAEMLPMAVMLAPHDCSVALEVLTVSGGGPSFCISLPMPMSWPICLDLTKASPLMRARTPRMART